jgi:CRP-like cAMP-binding protein
LERPTFRSEVPMPIRDEDDLEYSIFAKNTVIFEEGAAADNAYLIKSGHVQIVVGQGASESIIDTVGPGDIFGEMALVDDAPRSATARTTDDTICAVVSKDMLNIKLARSDLFTLGLVRLLIKRLRKTTELAR